MTSKEIQRTAPLMWFACLLVSSTLMALKWPIFTDEFAWKWITSRFWLDSGYAISLYPQCLEQGATKVPFLFIPIRMLEALLYGTAQSIFLLRWIGVLNFFCNGFLFWQLTLAIARVRKLNPKETFLGISAIGFFGVLPFLLSMNRPEQVLVFCLLLFAWLPLVEAKSRIQKWGLSFGFCTVSLLFFSQHAKALFFLPFVLVSSWNIKISKKSKMILAAWAVALASQCYFFFTEHTQCQNQFIQEAFGKMMISPAAILRSPLETLLRMAQNGFHVVDYIKSILISDVYPQEWLPTNYGFSLGTKILNGLIQLFFVVWISACAWGFLKKVRRDGTAPTYLNRMGLGILVGVLGMAVFQSGKSFYDSALVVPLFMALGIIFIDMEVMRLLGKGAFILATASVGLVAYRLKPSIKSDWVGEKTLVHQEYSVKPSYQKAIAKRVMGLADRCGIQSATDRKHLVVDDLTYPHFMKTPEPYHAVYVLGWWGKMSIENPSEFLQSKGSQGIISQCHWLPEDLLSRAVRDDDLCCLPAF